MGYYNHIRSIIYGSKEKIESFITSSILINNTTVFEDFKTELSRIMTPAIIHHTMDGTKIVESIHMIKLECYLVKWGDSYDDTIAWNNFMDQAVEAGLNYELVRIGEESDDIEYQQSDEALYLLSVRRSIVEDFDTTPLIEECSASKLAGIHYELEEPEKPTKPGEFIHIP